MISETKSSQAWHEVQWLHHHSVERGCAPFQRLLWHRTIGYNHESVVLQTLLQLVHFGTYCITWLRELWRDHVLRHRAKVDRTRMQTQWQRTNGSRRLVAIRPDAAASDLRNNIKRKKKNYQRDTSLQSIQSMASDEWLNLSHHTPGRIQQTPRYISLLLTKIHPANKSRTSCITFSNTGDKTPV